MYMNCVKICNKRVKTIGQMCIAVSKYVEMHNRNEGSIAEKQIKVGTKIPMEKNIRGN